jgi:hypothetical protein
MGYDIYVACTFSTDDAVNLQDLRIKIHAYLDMLSSHFNLTISAQINIIQPYSDVLFIAYLG